MLRKREIFFAGGGFVLALLLIGGGLWWNGHQNDKKPTNAKQTVSPDRSASANAGGLSVNGAAASNLGQLGGDQSAQGSSEGGSSGSSSSLDPSTFAQYEKYKNSKEALFGDIKPGNGAALTAGRKATVYYKGWLTNGALIDRSPVSANGQSQPFTFTEGNHEIIAGWEQAMYDMKAGGSRLLVIPPAVGYGAQGKGAVPPNAVLVFEVQLIKVE